jgi:glycerophosphoryl diester phosphodiesterase
MLLGVLAGVVVGALVGLRAGRRPMPGGGTPIPRDRPANIAHRGGAKIAPENTLEGFREGLGAGADVLELDVHLTADGHLVVIHDDTVDDTTDGSGPVREMTLAEVKRLDAGYDFPPDGGDEHPYRGKGVRVPTLEEVYGEFPDVPMNVEIKGKRPGVEEALWRAIEEAGAEGRTLVVSARTGPIVRFREVSGGRVATASSTKEMLSFDLLSRLGLARLLRPSYAALQGPEYYPGRLRIHMVTPGFVRAAHELGLRVDVWTIDREADMRRLLGYGVDGIMTDRPDVLARLLGRAVKDGVAAPSASP